MMTTLARSTPMTLAVIAAMIAAFVAAAVGLFKLTVGGAIALYFVVWWTLLFAVLPLRNQPETRPSHVVPGQDPGAPAAPRAGPSGPRARSRSPRASPAGSPTSTC